MGDKQNYSIICECATCGKQIFIPVVSMWAYKKNDNYNYGAVKYFCRWSCLRKFEKEYEEKKTKKKAEVINKRMEESRRIRLERAKNVDWTKV